MSDPIYVDVSYLEMPEEICEACGRLKHLYLVITDGAQYEKMLCPDWEEEEDILEAHRWEDSWKWIEIAPSDELREKLKKEYLEYMKTKEKKE
jgi:hypothetical protein